MNRDQADKLIAAMNTIESLRQEQDHGYLTETQGKAQLALTDLLEEEGFEIKYRFIKDARSNTDSAYSIVSQTAYNWNW